MLISQIKSDPQIKGFFKIHIYFQILDRIAISPEWIPLCSTHQQTHIIHPPTDIHSTHTNTPPWPTHQHKTQILTPVPLTNRHSPTNRHLPTDTHPTPTNTPPGPLTNTNITPTNTYPCLTHQQTHTPHPPTLPLAHSSTLVRTEPATQSLDNSPPPPLRGVYSVQCSQDLLVNHNHLL